MGFLDAIKGLFALKTNRAQVNYTDLTAEESSLLSEISRINSVDGEITPELYQQLRDFEVAWLERHYDFNTLDGINAIPVTQNPQRPPTTGVTGEVYYYLRHKCYEHEKAGNMELALACIRKSNDLLRVSGKLSKNDEYVYVKMLARAGLVEKAQQIKNIADRTAVSNASKFNKQLYKKALKLSSDFDTDLIIMSVHGCTCSECAKYQGRVYSISGKHQLFPKIPSFINDTGTVHDKCGHSFFPYIHGVNDPDLDYTLSVHPLKDQRFGANIVVFSNRPFVDDRTDECIAAAAEARQKEAESLKMQQEYEERMIEIEARRGRETRDFYWLQEIFPEKCPKSVTGYRRMKTQNTKNYQVLKSLAAERGRDI